MSRKTKTKRAQPYRGGGQLLRTIRKRRGLSLHDAVERINKEYGKEVFHTERDLVRAESGETRVWPRDALIALVKKVYEQNDFVVDDVLNKSGYDTLHQGAPSELVLIETSRLIWSPAEAKSLPATVTPSGTPGVLPTEGLVAYYPLNGNTDDKSKYRNNGRVFGGVRDIPDGKRWVPNLDGSSGYVSAPDQPWLRVEQFTLAAWIYLKETTGHRRIIEKGNSNSYWFYLNHDRPLVGFYDGRH